MKTRIIFILLLLVALTSCFYKHYKYYSIRFENDSDKEVQLIQMKSASGAHIPEMSFLPGKSISYGLPMKYPANDIYEIQWRDSTKKIRYSEFDLRESLPVDFKGDVVFSFKENDELIFYQWLSPYQYDYSIDIINNSGSTIYKPLIKSSRGVLHITDYLRDKLLNGDEIKFRHMRKFPANSVYTITWLSENGVEYGKEIDLTQTIDEDFDGAVQFTINEEHQVGYSCK